MSIRLSTLTSVASDLLNDALRLDNELSALAATCSLRSVSKVQINHLGLQDPLWNRKIQWRVSKVSSCKFRWKFCMIWIKVFFSLSENLELIRWVTSLLSPSENMQFCNEQIRTQPLFSPPCASATYDSARMCRRKNCYSRKSNWFILNFMGPAIPQKYHYFNMKNSLLVAAATFWHNFNGIQTY